MTFRNLLAAALLVAAAPAAAQSDLADGQVTKVDRSAGKITIKHGPLPQFELNEEHTMVFRVQDPAMLKTVKVGDKIKFDTDRSSGQFTVTKIEKVK